MKEIILSRGLVALVDDEDYALLNKYKWHAIKGTNTFYAVRSIREGAKSTKVYMHKQLKDCPSGFFVDHADRNGLNCQKSNLRVCTKSQNGCNKKANGKVPYLGVSIHQGKYRVQIRGKNGKRVPLPGYETAQEAALAYNREAIRHHGEFANLNLVP